MSVIHNGFDPGLIPEPRPAPAPRFTLLHAGSLVARHRDPRPVFRALELCLARQQIPGDQVEIQFLGANPEQMAKVLSEAATSLPVRVLPRVPHRAALAAQMSASVLLLLAHAAEPGVMTGKVFDYLAAGRPILAVPDDGETTSNLLRQTGAGVALTEVEAIARQLAEWYAAWKLDRAFNLQRDDVAIAKYSRREQSKQLAALLDELSER